MTRPDPARTPAPSPPDPRARVLARVVALALALLTTALLSVGHRDVGYVRDEGIYFAAGRSYARWAERLLHDPGAALTAAARDRAFRSNNEHPALLKLLSGVSGRLLSHPTSSLDRAEARHDPPVAGALPSLPEGAAMRLPAQLLAGLAVGLLVVAGRALAGGLLAGLLAAGWFILLPRVWFHAGLNCFDVPIAALTLAVVLVYRRALGDPRWGLWLGPLVGVAISIKHNALFLPLLLGLHYALCLLAQRRRPGAPRLRASQLAPLPFLSIAALAPLVFVALWPWLWSDPVARLSEYFAFHLHHSWYNIEFLGTNYNRPPMPVALPAVLTWATVPTVLLALSLIGLVLLLRVDLQRLRTASETREDAPAPSWRRPLPDPTARNDGLLLAIFGLFPIALISLPTVPVFGGSKHWITAYPFLALSAAYAWGRLWSGLRPRPGLRGRVAQSAALVLVLAPAAWSTLRGHPYNLSQYAPLVGGPRGAADLGLNRGFWGYAALPLLTAAAEAEAAAPPRQRARAGLYLHDLHHLARWQYEREGRWPAGPDASASRARAGLLFHERHMLTYETELWRALGTTAPARVLELHDVPLTSLYVTP